MTKEMYLFFSRKKRLDFFRTNEQTPYSVLETAISLYTKALELLKKEGVDGEQYLQTPEGQTEYNEFCNMEEKRTQLHERCGRCVSYSYDGDNYECLKKNNSMDCEEFLDSEFDFSTRIQKFIYRCEKCKNAIKSTIKEVDINKVQCSKKLNLIAVECPEENK